MTPWEFPASGEEEEISGSWWRVVPLEEWQSLPSFLLAQLHCHGAGTKEDQLKATGISSRVPPHLMRRVLKSGKRLGVKSSVMPFFPVLLTSQHVPFTSWHLILIYTVEGKGGLAGSAYSHVLFCVVKDSSWKLLPVGFASFNVFLYQGQYVLFF